MLDADTNTARKRVLRATGAMLKSPASSRRPVSGKPAIDKPLPKPAPMPASDFVAYRVNDVALTLGICRATVYNWMKAKKLRSVVVLGCRLIPADAIRDLLQSDT
jgi:predicted DNA-binding transcriptional regulator AlpA